MKVVIAYDGSQDAKEGLNVAKKFLKEVIDELILLYVVRKREGMSKEEEEKEIEKAKKLLEEAKAEIKDEFVIREAIIADYSIAEAILNFVESEEADMLIMGARGVRPDIIRYTLGSTTAKVVSFAPCSVYIAKKK
ncbi:UspA domain-containing protein [Thermodesulfobacterium geofontis OPF15]|jgi:nucleotide-binding universal stress UspA family protein|uniref:UspA domain-containing protein n=2 Tax=Thermodesulfobacterium geofontis TaxID=1295609 RepID=F8C2Y0_THEGP|nr:universal stress protein [Thermodesulfobacterium geofontis]AEH22362.1 UspA domain-containing protein [Thermodesulfobacterium geofontis OPF15]